MEFGIGIEPRLVTLRSPCSFCLTIKDYLQYPGPDRVRVEIGSNAATETSAGADLALFDSKQNKGVYNIASITASTRDHNIRWWNFGKASVPN